MLDSKRLEDTCVCLVGRAGELRLSHMLGSRYGDSLRLIIGVLRC